MIRNLWGDGFSPGRIFWVAPAAAYTIDGNSYDASDDNDGLDPRRALRTINRGWALCTANVGDTIILLPGTHAPTATIAASVAGVTMMGAGTWMQRPNFMRPRAVITGAAAVAGITITGANITLAGFGLTVATGQAGFTCAAATNLYVHDCNFDMNTANGNVATISIANTATSLRAMIENCSFQGKAGQGPAISLTASGQWVIRNNYFYVAAGTWANSILVGATATQNLIDKCHFITYIAAGVITAAIDGTGATIVPSCAITDCRFGNGCTVPIDNFDAGEATISENYKLGVGAADGGSLITAIT